MERSQTGCLAFLSKYIVIEFEWPEFSVIEALVQQQENPLSQAFKTPPQKESKISIPQAPQFNCGAYFYNNTNGRSEQNPERPLA